MTQTPETKLRYFHSPVYSLEEHLAKARPELLQFLQEYAFSSALVGLASQHYKGDGTEMNMVEQLLYQSGLFMAQNISRGAPDFLACPESAAVIGIPRSGWSVAKGISDGLKAHLFYSNQGNDSSKGHPILSEEILNQLPEAVVIADNVSMYGRQARTLLQALTDYNQNLDIAFAFSCMDNYWASDLCQPIVTTYAPKSGLTNPLWAHLC